MLRRLIQIPLTDAVRLDEGKWFVSGFGGILRGNQGIDAKYITTIQASDKYDDET